MMIVDIGGALPMSDINSSPRSCRKQGITLVLWRREASIMATTRDAVTKRRLFTLSTMWGSFAATPVSSGEPHPGCCKRVCIVPCGSGQNI